MSAWYAAAFSTAGRQHACTAVQAAFGNSKASTAAAVLFAAGLAAGELG